MTSHIRSELVLIYRATRIFTSHHFLSLGLKSLAMCAEACCSLIGLEDHVVFIFISFLATLTGETEEPTQT